MTAGTSAGASATQATTDPSDASEGTDPTAGSADGTGTASAGTDDTGGTVSCEPDAADDECSMCTKASCCEQLGACFESKICTCMTGCATGLDSIAMCTEMCGTSPEFSGLTSCVTVNCAAACI